MRIVLPPGGYDWRATAIPVSDLIPGRQQALSPAFRSIQVHTQNPGLTFFEIHLKEGQSVRVENFGIPFCNPGHAAEQWLRYNKPFFGKVTLQHIMNQRSFYLVLVKSVAEVEQMASTPVRPNTFVQSMYGQRHDWDIKRYTQQQQQSGFKGKTIQAYESFQSDNEQIAILTQSVVQDYMWLHDAKKAILQRQWPAYFIPCEEGEDRKYFVVIHLNVAFREYFSNAWRMFTRETARKRVRLSSRWNGSSDSELGYDSESDSSDNETNFKKPCPDWDANIIDGAEDIAILKPHLQPRGKDGKLPQSIEELVLRVSRPDIMDKKRVPDFQLVDTFDSLVAAQEQGKES